MVKHGNGELFIDCFIYLMEYLNEPPENGKELAEHILKYLESVPDYSSNTKFVEKHWRVDLKSDSISEIIHRAGKIKKELFDKLDTSIDLYIGYNYVGQCNLEFGNADLLELSAIGGTLSVSCYEFESL